MLGCLHPPPCGWQSPGRGGEGRRLRRRLRAPRSSLGIEGALGCGEQGERFPPKYSFTSLGGFIKQAVRAHSGPKGCSRLSPPSLWSSEPSLVLRGKPGPSQSRRVSPPAPQLPSRSRGTLEALSPRPVEALPGFRRTGSSRICTAAAAAARNSATPALTTVTCSVAARASRERRTCPSGQLEEGKEPRGLLGLCRPRCQKACAPEVRLGAWAGTRPRGLRVAGCKGCRGTSGAGETRGSRRCQAQGDAERSGRGGTAGAGGTQSAQAQGYVWRGGAGRSGLRGA